MKKVILFTLLTVFTCGYSTAKEKSVSETAKKELKTNVNKDNRKAAKKIEKEGWVTMPGRVSLEKQIERSQIAEVSVDENGDNINLIGTHKAIGGNYSAAKNIATIRAKGELASQLKANVKRSIMDKNANKQVSKSDIQLLDETISAMLESVDIDIMGVNNLLEVYRDAEDGKCEVMITLSVKAQPLMDKSIKDLSKELSDKTNLLF